MKSINIQLYSDIHLELNEKIFPKIKPLCDYLFLAGDIGKINTPNFKDFFDYCSANWKKIFYVLGNHEYYHSHKSYLKLNQEYKDFFKGYSNVHLLDNDIYEFDDFVILGSTLWSYVGSSMNLNDFAKIKSYDETKQRTYNISIEEFNDLHIKCLNFLNTQIDKYKEKKIIIMTHFPPSQENTSHPKYNNQLPYLKDYFASNCIDDISDDHNIITWIYGHTHYSNSINHKKKIKLISNQMGYLDEFMDSRFNEDGLYKIILEY
jgi:predicted phosphohydrolase